jgi:cell division protein FtsW
VALTMLIAVYFLDRSHETHRWFRLGPLSLQPSELAKLALIVFLAWFLELRTAPRGFGINNVRHTLLPALGTVLLIVALVYREPDMGTACMIFFIAAVMLFVAGISLRYVGAVALAAIPVAYFAVVTSPYRLQRMKTFFSPGADPQGHGFQLLQSLIAVGSGGFSGVGLMESRQKLFFLPEAHTDFIFSVIAEELGYIGGIILITLFAVYGWRALVAAMKAPDDFGKYLGIGVATMVVGQALINLSVVLGLVPTKGIPLPFVSYGGSNLLGMLLATGVLLNISQHADET